MIYRDCWKGYSHLINRFIENRKVNQTNHYKDPLDVCHTNTIVGTCSAIKMHVSTIEQTINKIDIFLVIFMPLRS